MSTKISLQCSKLTKPMCLIDVMCAFLKINRGISNWLKLHGIVSFIHWNDSYRAVECALRYDETALRRSSCKFPTN